MRCRDQAYVHAASLDCSKAPNFAFLEYAQQSRLGFQGKFSYLIEEQGSAVGRLHEATAGVARACEGPLFMSEKLRLDE